MISMTSMIASTIPEACRKTKMNELRWLAVFVNTGCMFLSLWVAFAKVNRPITWKAFYFNLGAAAINLLAVLLHLYKLATT